MIVHNCRNNTAQNSSDNLPSYLQTNTIAQMFSIRGDVEVKIGPLASEKQVLERRP